MTLGDLKRHLYKTRLHEMMVKDVNLFDQRWNTFITEFKLTILQEEVDIFYKFIIPYTHGSIMLH